MLTLFGALILPARSTGCSRYVPQLGVLLCPLARCSNRVPCCVPWPFLAPLPSPFSFSSFFHWLLPSSLRACFESAVGAVLNNLLLLDIWSELSTFWHKFAVVHDKGRAVPAFGKSRPGVLLKRSVFGTFLGRYDRSQPQISAIFSKTGTWFGLRWPDWACCGGICGRALWKWVRKSLFMQALRCPVGRSLWKRTWESARRKRVRKSSTTHV